MLNLNEKNSRRGDVILTYENVINQAEHLGLFIYEKKMPYKLKGLYADNVICINKSLPTTTDKKCVAVEEIGHHETSSGDILDQAVLSNRKQEQRAKAWGYEYLIPLNRIVEAGQAGVEGKHDVAEYLNVTEEFLQNTIEYYQRKFGLHTEYNDYLIYFEPLSITKL